MEQFMDDIRDFARRCGVKPSTVIQRAVSTGGATWRRWEAGESSPTLHTVDKIRRYMADNPPPTGEDAQTGAAA
jgi:transcriptional regulator with XRE-family HTH domain